MKYEIFGDNLPAVTIYLNEGEAIYTQSGGLTWMSSEMAMETNTKGGLLKGLARMVSGESLFLATYTAQAPDQFITCASTFPGHIIALDVTGKNYIAQKSAFLCAEPDVEVSATLPEGVKLTARLFGGEGIIMQGIKGRGYVFLEIDGSVRELDLAVGEKIIVNTGNVACYESSVKFSVETVKGLKNIVFGGEGLFLTTLEGPGKVWLQTMTMPSFARRIIPFLPEKKDK